MTNEEFKEFTIKIVTKIRDIIKKDLAKSNIPHELKTPVIMNILTSAFANIAHPFIKKEFQEEAIVSFGKAIYQVFLQLNDVNNE